MIKVPPRICLNTGDDADTRNTIDDFLSEVYLHLVEKYDLESGNGIHPHFEKRREELFHCGGHAATNGCVHYLKYQDQVVATVMETRTGFNYIQFDFFLNLGDLYLID